MHSDSPGNIKIYKLSYFNKEIKNVKNLINVLLNSLHTVFTQFRLDNQNVAIFLHVGCSKACAPGCKSNTFTFTPSSGNTLTLSALTLQMVFLSLTTTKNNIFHEEVFT